MQSRQGYNDIMDIYSLQTSQVRKFFQDQPCTHLIDDRSTHWELTTYKSIHTPLAVADIAW